LQLKKEVYAIILASGSGQRLGSEIPKQFLKILDKTILEYSIEAFDNSPEVDKIIIVSNPDYRNRINNILKQRNVKKPVTVVDGGKTRRDSSFNGISAIKNVNSKVLIHDAVRPLVSGKIISDCIKMLDNADAVNVAIPATDTIFKISNDNNCKKIVQVPDRSLLMRAQTPQAFNFSIIKKAHDLANLDKEDTSTDDCGLIMKYTNSDVYIVDGDEKNLKITFPSDLKTAEILLS